MPSIFSLIIEGTVPCVLVHEDKQTMAIMDIKPIQKGQILVFPKVEVGTIWELSNPTYRALMDTVKKAGQKISEVFPDKKRVGVIIEGLEVTDHAHVKVFPFSSTSEFHAIPSYIPKSNELRSMALKLKF